jgi:carboxyl-terminal processing protease
MRAWSDDRGARRIRWHLIGALLLQSVLLQATQDWRPASLLAFDEVWQTIDDSYYDPAFGGLSWPAVRAELRPRVERADTPDAARQAIREMLGRLKQSHFVLLSSADSQALPGDATLPIDVRVVAAGVVVTRVDLPSDLRDRLKPGDRIIRLDGQEISAWFDRAEGSDDRATRLSVWERVFRTLHGADGSVARLTITDPEGRQRTVDIPRSEPRGETVTLGNLPPLQVRVDSREVRTPGQRHVGLIAFNLWMAAVAEPVAAAVDRYRSADGLVVDLRGNPGGLAEMMRGIAGHFLPTPELLGRVHMRNLDLEFRANPRRSTSDGRRVEPFTGPLAILVDELTASASECFSGGLQSLGRAHVIGTQTMGRALPASTRQLSNGDVLMYAIGDFATSTGRRLEGIGVIPDETVALSIEMLAQGRDAVLERALAWIDRQVITPRAR